MGTKGKRESKYETHVKPHLDKIYEVSKKGATLKAIAEMLGIPRQTLCDYRDRYPELKKAIEVATDIATDNVEYGLYTRAVGQTYEEITRKPLVDVIAKKLVKEYNAEAEKHGRAKITVEDVKEKFENETVITQRTTKVVPPDTASAMIWLSNKRPDNWKHRNALEAKGEGEMSKRRDEAEKRVREAQEKGKKDGSVIELKDKRA